MKRRIAFAATVVGVMALALRHRPYAMAPESKPARPTAVPVAHVEAEPLFEEPVDLRARLGAGLSWEDREEAIAALGPRQAAAQESTLLDVIRGEDADAVRAAAVDKLADVGRRRSECAELLRALCALLRVEQRRGVRDSLVCAVAALPWSSGADEAIARSALEHALASEADPAARGEITSARRARAGAR